MTNDVIPKSRNKTYKDQKKLIASHAKKSGIPYTLLTALEATTAILMHYVETRKYIYKDNKKGSQCTYTRCQEKVNKNQWPPAIGRFSSGGLFVYSTTVMTLSTAVGVCGSSRTLDFGSLGLG